MLHFPNGGSFEAQWENGQAVGPGTGVGVAHTTGRGETCLVVHDPTEREVTSVILIERRSDGTCGLSLH